MWEVLAEGAKVAAAAKQAVDLIRELRAARNKKESEPLVLSLRNLEKEALRISGELGNRLRQMNSDLRAMNIKTDQPLGALYKNTSWLKFPSRGLMRSLRTQFGEMYVELAGFMDDVTAMLICSDRTADAKLAFASGLQVKRELDEMMRNDPSIDEMILQMTTIADAIRIELQSDQGEMGTSSASAGG